MTRVIKQLEDLLAPYLTSKRKFVSCDFKNLLSSGENYGSVMLQVEIKVTRDDGKEEILHCVGKTVPPSEMLWKLFNTKVTFKKEIAVYNVIVPELNKYGQEFGIDRLINFTAECLGARISLDPKSENVDNDAVLLLENLKVSGYAVGDRFTGFDEATSKFLLTDLAVMHASVIAYKTAKPAEFTQKMLPFLNRDYAFDITEYFAENFGEAIAKVCAKNAQCVPHLSKIKKSLQEINHFNANPARGKDIYRTFTHNDFWTNNTLIKYENDKPIANKMVDFQVIEYSSLAHDVIFFLYSSVSMDVLEKKVDELMRFYYDRFIETFVSLKCDIGEYSFDGLMTELSAIAKDGQFAHLLYMLVPILTLKSKAKELAEFDLNDLIFEEGSLHEMYPRRMQFTLLDFVRRGWL